MQVLEFVAFGERLARSHTRAAATAEVAAAKLRAVTASLPAKPTAGQLAALTAEAAAAAGDDSVSSGGNETGKLGGLRHNDDLSLRPGWLPPTGAPARLALVGWWDPILDLPQLRDSSCAGLKVPSDSPSGTNGSSTKNSPSSTHSSSGNGVPWWHATGAAEGDDAVLLREAQVLAPLAPCYNI